MKKTNVRTEYLKWTYLTLTKNSKVLIKWSGGENFTYIDGSAEEGAGKRGEAEILLYDPLSLQPRGYGQATNHLQNSQGLAFNLLRFQPWGYGQAQNHLQLGFTI